MQIQTTRFGNIEIDENKIIHFEEGIPAFEQEKEFVLIPFDEQSPFIFMQSVKNSDLAFLVTNPFNFFQDYELTITDDVEENLQIRDENDVLVLVLLTIQNGDIKTITANLMAPIIINQSNYQAIQMVMEDSIYKTAHLIRN